MRGRGLVCAIREFLPYHAGERLAADRLQALVTGVGGWGPGLCQHATAYNKSMARIEGISDQQANIFTRAVYGAVRKKLGRVPEPMRISALQQKLMAAVGGMEMAQEGMRSVDPVLKALVGIKAATRIGCAF